MASKNRDPLSTEETSGGEGAGGAWSRDTYEGELVSFVVPVEEVYEDDYDENDESNWRNDYPEEETDGDSDREERSSGYWEEEQSYSPRRSWDSYQRAVLKELGWGGEEDENEDDDDEDGDK